MKLFILKLLNIRTFDIGLPVNTFTIFTVFTSRTTRISLLLKVEDIEFNIKYHTIYE